MRFSRIAPKVIMASHPVQRRLYLSAALAAVSFAVYAKALGAGFVYDDNMLVLQNGWIRDFSHIGTIFTSEMWEFGTERSNYYRPLMHLLYALDYRMFGLEPWGYHLVNVLLHCAVTVAVFFTITELLKQAGSEAGLLPPFLGAALFAVHPVNTEAVAWVACQPEVAFTLLYLLSFLAYIRARADDGWRAGFLLSGALFFPAMLFKETALTLPLLVAGYEYVYWGGWAALRPSIKRHLPIAAAMFAYMALRINALGGITAFDKPGVLGGYEYAINLPVYIAYYFQRLALPFDLNLSHVFHPVGSALSAKAAASYIVAAAFIALLARSGWRRRPILFLGLLVILLPLLPVVYTSKIAGEKTFYERYLYLSTFGYAMLAAMPFGVAGPGDRRRKGVSLAAAAVIVMFSVCTVERNGEWRDELSFWLDASRKSPDAVVPHNGLGVLYGRSGQSGKAEDEFRAVLMLDPDDPEALNNLGIVSAGRGELDKAAGLFEKAIAVMPGYAGAHYNLGMALEDKGEFDRAISHLETAVRLAPYDMDYRDELGRARALKGGPSR